MFLRVLEKHQKPKMLGLQLFYREGILNSSVEYQCHGLRGRDQSFKDQVLKVPFRNKNKEWNVLSTKIWLAYENTLYSGPE